MYGEFTKRSISVEVQFITCKGDQYIPNMTIRVPEDLKSAMDAHPEINWSEVARQSMWEYIHKLRLADSIAAESDLSEADAKELSEDVKADIAKYYEA